LEIALMSGVMADFKHGKFQGALPYEIILELYQKVFYFNKNIINFLL